MEQSLISITEKALQQIKSISENENADGTKGLRLAVTGGGCSGLSYKMDFDTMLKDGDKAFEAFGEKIVVDGQSLLYLIGMTLDYSGGLNGKGFVFNNPNATKNCGCGSSFNV